MDTANELRGPLLLMTGGKDHTVPAAITQSECKKYRHSDAVTEVHEFPDRAHSLTIDRGWREVADVALAWLADKSLGPDAAARGRCRLPGRGGPRRQNPSTRTRLPRAGSTRRRSGVVMDLHLAGKVAVVTGASKGIGLAVTRSAGRRGSPGGRRRAGRRQELDELAGAASIRSGST